MGTYKERLYTEMAQVLVRERIFQMHADGKTIEQIATALSPWGALQPSPVTGLVRNIIEVAVGRGEIAERLTDEPD